MPHRQAYWPRLWPQALAAMVISGVVELLTPLSLPVTLGVNIAIGCLGSQIRFEIWKRRHPILSIQQLQEHRRETAKWN